MIQALLERFIEPSQLGLIPLLGIYRTKTTDVDGLDGFTVQLKHTASLWWTNLARHVLEVGLSLSSIAHFRFQSLVDGMAQAPHCTLPYSASEGTHIM